MTALVFEIEAISNLALQVAKAVVDKNEETGKIEDKQSGPLAVASALSDFFELATALDHGNFYLEGEELREIGNHGLDLLDRLAYQALVLEVLEERETMARAYASIAVWFSRRDAILDNLEGIADGFGQLTNRLNEPRELAEMCHFMEEVVAVCADEIKMDNDKSNPFRPWRVLNLNAGIAATRSLDPDLMEQTFEELGRRLPNDMPGFLADGRRQMATQNVPDAVLEVMDRYVEKWPSTPSH